MTFETYLQTVLNLVVTAGGLNGKSIDQYDTYIEEAHEIEIKPYDCARQLLRIAGPYQNSECFIDPEETYSYDVACSDQTLLAVENAIVTINCYTWLDTRDPTSHFLMPNAWVSTYYNDAVNAGIVFC